MSIINPCPFCGSLKLKVENQFKGNKGSVSAFVKCGKCSASGPVVSNRVKMGDSSFEEKTIQEAIEKWNNLTQNCKGCKHIGIRLPFASMYPCNCCRRANSEDYYTTEIRK